MRSFPWDSIATSWGDDGLPVYDRSYSAADLRSVYETFIKDGVFMDEGDELRVSADGSGMSVSVAAGKCCVKGTVGEQDAALTADLAPASSLDRIDTVVLRWDADSAARSITVEVKQGVAAESPVRPSLTRGEVVWELGLADVRVPANATAVSAVNVTDTRLETDRCGAASPFAKIDTDTIFRQLNEATQAAVELAESALDGTTAGYLQGLIDDCDKLEGASEATSLDQGLVGNFYVAKENAADALAAFGELPKPETAVPLSLRVFNLQGSGGGNLRAEVYIPGFGKWSRDAVDEGGWGKWSCSEGVTSVSDSGKVGDWDVMKYDNGMAILHYRAPLRSYAITTETGSLFRTEAINVEMPITMADTRFSVFGALSNALYEVVAYPKGVGEVQYIVRNPVKVSSVNAYVQITVVGRWKNDEE